jgi:hypothetical protein
MSGSENLRSILSQNKTKLSILISLLILIVNPSSLIGETVKSDIRVEITYSPETKGIRLSVSNKGVNSIKIYNPDLKIKDPINTPATLEVRMKNKKGKLLGKNVFGVAENGFMSNEIFDSRLFSLPLSPITMKTNEAFKLDTSFDRLIWGYRHKNYIPEIPDDIGFIQLRYGVILDPNAESIITFTTEWLTY